MRFRRLLFSSCRGGARRVDNFAGWLTTIVAACASTCSANARRDAKSRSMPEVEALPAAENPEREKLIAESVGVALLVVLETLTPAERVAFVLHDLFNISFDEIAPVVGRSPTAARQLASRGRRRVQGAPADREADRARQREIVRRVSRAPLRLATFPRSSPSSIPTLCCVQTRAPWKPVRVRMYRGSPRRSAVATRWRTSSGVARGGAARPGGRLFRPRVRARRSAAVVVDFVDARMTGSSEISMIAEPERIRCSRSEVLPSTAFMRKLDDRSLPPPLFGCNRDPASRYKPEEPTESAAWTTMPADNHCREAWPAFCCRYRC